MNGLRYVVLGIFIAGIPCRLIAQKYAPHLIPPLSFIHLLAFVYLLGDFAGRHTPSTIFRERQPPHPDDILIEKLIAVSDRNTLTAGEEQFIKMVAFDNCGKLQPHMRERAREIIERHS